MSEKIKIRKEITMEDLQKIAGGSAIDWDDLSGPPYTCPLCNAVTSSKDEIVSHIMGEIAKVITHPV